jgi:glycosyltransferase involved in cell wall biosynthesis
MREVTVVQRVLPHYRVPFFDALRTELAERGVRLRLLVGQPTQQEASKADSGQLDWAETVRNRYIRLGGKGVVWQPCLWRLASSELVIVEQASRLLLNYVLFAWRVLRGPRVAFWGHGKNLDSEQASPTGELIKRKMVRRADWWFCYTEGTARIVEGLGVPSTRRTVVRNAVDTTAVSAFRVALTEADLATTRLELGLGDGPVAVALGSIYKARRPHFLIESADEIRRLCPGFELVVIGDGPERDVIDQASRTRPWLHVVGARTGSDMVRYTALASLALNPGVVGLAVLDAFALGIPMITCDVAGHGPEIEYIDHGVNGMILAETATPLEFATEAAGLFTAADRLEQLRASALETAATFTMSQMVERFASGILNALGDRGGLLDASGH